MPAATQGPRVSVRSSVPLISASATRCGASQRQEYRFFPGTEATSRRRPLPETIRAISSRSPTRSTPAKVW